MEMDERADELATNESYEVLSSALFQALEADLSGLGWPKKSKSLLEKTFKQIDQLCEMTEPGF